MTSKTEPKLSPPVTIRKLRRELCALQEELGEARRLLAATAAHATRCALQRDNARKLLRDVWEATTREGVPFFERLNLLRPFVPRVGEELTAMEKGEG